MTAAAQLAEFIRALPITSTHEHHLPDEAFRGFDLDALLARSYVAWASPAQERRRVVPEELRGQAFFVWLARAVRAIYGGEKLTAANWDDVSAAIRAAHAASPTWHLDVMRAHGGYRRAIQDTYPQPGSAVGHPEFFAPAYRVNAWVLCHHPAMTDHNGHNPWQLEPDLPQVPGLPFDQYLSMLRGVIGRWTLGGAVALKSALAYDRDLAFGPPDRATAARVFGRPPDAVTREETRAYQDFMMDYLCTLAAEHGLPFQHHTGLGLLGGSHPLHLAPLIARHPHTQFVLLHGGYPWTHDIGALAHTYPNVYPDLTWLPLLSPTAAVHALQEWIEVGRGATRICWGGDTWTGEEAVGATLALRHVLTHALGELLRRDYLDLDDAREIARGICHANAERLYGMRGDSVDPTGGPHAL